MGSRLRIAFSRAMPSLMARRACKAFLSGAFLLCPLLAHAQSPPPGAVGRIEGNDVSVASGTAASSGTSRRAPSIYVLNGGVVTVHSGNARMTLLPSGQLEICGPAQFTVLQSGNGMTLALNFGRIHVDSPPNASLQIFSPSIIATPIDINGRSPNITIGLQLDESLCARATSGAIQLENQFSGQKLIVPEGGNFLLKVGQFVPVADVAGSCRCAPAQPRATPESPPIISEFARAQPSLPAPPPPLRTPGAAPSIPQPGESTFAVSMPENANQAHPTAHPKIKTPENPTVAANVQTAVVPTLSFMASAMPPPPPGPSPETLLLVREARVSPDWEFSGNVDVPPFVRAMHHALDDQPASVAASAAAKEPRLGRRAGSSARKRKKKRHGFWAALVRFFAGNAAADEPPQ